MVYDYCLKYRKWDGAQKGKMKNISGGVSDLICAVYISPNTPCLARASPARQLQNFIFPSFKTTHTTLFWFLGDTQGARFYDMHGTTLHLFVMLFPVQYMEKHFALETREGKLFDKN